MLTVEGLSASYGAVQALRDVSFSAAARSVTAVLGANGAGKTTLLRAMTSLVRPTSGRVVFDGKQMTGLAVEQVVRHGMAHVPEGRGVLIDLTVEENLRLGALARRRPRDLRRSLDRVYELFPALRERRRRAASTLSGGERQMLAIGRALAAEPKALLLDEPSLGLAPIVVAQVMEVVRGLAEEDGITVVLVEQNVRSALSIAARAVVLNLGRVVADAESGELAGDEQLRHHYLGY